MNAEAKLKWIHERIAEGRTVYLSTALRVTKLTKKHLAMVRVKNGALEIQHGKRWIDYSFTKITAQ